MMRTIGLLSLVIVSAAVGDDMQDQIRNRSGRTVLEESTAAGQASVVEQGGTGYGLELRPRISEDEVGVALRIYMPEYWKKAALREQIVLVAESEQLRVAALEWRELMQAYRLFCDYRMLNSQQLLLEKEIARLEPVLEKADKAVGLNQLAVSDRTRLYGLYLDFVNDHEKTMARLLDTEQELRLLLGAEADLGQMAEVAVVGMPPKTEFDALLARALDNRSDYRQFDVQARSLAAAAQTAGQAEGFRLKYIQPSYDVDHGNGEGSFTLSASFVLPWGMRNSAANVFRQQEALAASERELQRLVIGHRLRVMLKSAEAYYAKAGERSARIKPILTRIVKDLEVVDTGRLEELRDVLSVRERLLDVSLESAAAICRKERLAVDLAEELGTLEP